MLFSQYAQQLFFSARLDVDEQKYTTVDEILTAYSLSLHVDFEHKTITREDMLVDNPFSGYIYQPSKCKGYEYKCYIPAQGDIWLLTCKPMTAHRAPLYEGKFNIDYEKHNVTLVYHIAETELLGNAEEQANYIKRKIDSDIIILRDIVKALLEDIAQYNVRMRDKLSQYYQQHQKQKTAIAQTDKILGIEVVSKSEKPINNNFTENTKDIQMLTRSHNVESFPDFSAVEKIIYNNGTAMESDVTGFQTQDEAGLRSHILAALKACGINASAETINRGGKTDICIERDGQKHIVECKIWNGPETPESTLEQLLDYCTWHEKTGTIIIFNRKNRKFCDILDSIAEILSKYQNYRQLQKNAWSFVDTSDGDKQITVYCFDLCDKGYSAKQKTKKT